MLRESVQNHPPGPVWIKDQLYFLKRGLKPCLEAEREGLIALEQAQTGLIIPKSVLIDNDDQGYFMVVTGLTLGSKPNWHQLAKGIKKLHRKSNTHFGWQSNNWIGQGQQDNTWKNKWADFFTDCRLKPKFLELEKSGTHIAEMTTVLAYSRSLLDNHHPVPVLVHGDLWSGNVGFTPKGPTIFDPAVYYGDKEVDLAMTKLFGGFSSSFHEAYHQQNPFPSGYPERQELYNLYHLLNHACLFGGHYVNMCQRSIQSLLSK